MKQTTSVKKKPPHPRAVNPRYNGYLKPFAARIEQLASEGKSPLQIARILYAEGVRSPGDTGPDEHGHRMDHVSSFTGLIRFMLCPSNAKEKLQQRIARTRQQLRELEQQETDFHASG